MLRHIGEIDCADAVESSVTTVLGYNELRTGDLGGSATSTEMTDAIIKLLLEN